MHIKKIGLFSADIVVIGLLLIIATSLTAQHPGSFEFAKRMYQDGFLQEARIVFERIIANQPTSPEAEESLFLLAGMFKDADNHSMAEEYYRTLFETFPAGRFREQALFNWALSQHKQDKYLQALETFNRFIQVFPGSTNRQEALYFLIDCHYHLTNYSRVISIAQDFMEEHPASSRVPDLLLLNAKSYLRLNNRNDGENTLDLIIQRHPNADARWESVLIRVNLLKTQIGTHRAVDELNKHLAVSGIPRRYEEKLRKQLADFYLQDNRSSNALEQLLELIVKFDRSEDLAEYLFLISGIRIENNDYQPVVAYYERFHKDIQAAAYHYDFLVRVTEAFFYLARTEEAEQIIAELEAMTAAGIEPNIFINKFAGDYWQARIKEHKGIYLQAINDFRNLLVRLPLTSDTRYDILMRIGDIYLEKMQVAPTAANYYNQIITGINPNPNQLARALFKTALAYEVQGDYEKAVNTLRQINPDLLADDAERKTVRELTELLRRYRRIDYQRTTSNLLFSLLNYLNDDNRPKLKESLINIALYDLKDTDAVLSLLKDENSLFSLYMQGKAYIEQVNRALLERKSPARPQENLQTIISKMQQQPNLSGQDKAMLGELLIEQKIIANNQRPNPEILAEIEKFLSDYPKSQAYNRFSFLAGSHYLNNRLFVKADEYFRNVSLTPDISLYDFGAAFNRMAEYLFENEQYERSLFYYGAVELDVTAPEDMYRYAVSLIKTNRLQRGVEILDLLVKNVSDFQGIEQAIDVLANHYRTREEYAKAVNAMGLLPEKKRTPAFYVQLSKDYLSLNDKQKAKESLMYITDKDNEVLRSLAKLHYETNDLLMAEITYQELIKSDKEKQHQVNAQAMLAHINFLRENWQTATQNYEKVLNDIGSRTEAGLLSLTDLARGAVISYYRINNRPRAEAVQKRFKPQIDADINVLAEIELNEGIYQMTVNRNRADKSFNDIIRNRNYPEDIKLEAYFWKGLNNLEIKKIDDAYKDFQQAAKSPNINLRNKAYLKLGTISFSQEKFQQSLDYYYTVIQEDETGVLALDAAKNFAIVCKTIEEWQKAINAYNIILERGGEGKLEGETIFNIAFCQFRDRKYQDAVPMFERSITLLNDREMKAEAQYWIGESYANLGQFDQAATEYLKVGYYYPDLVQWVAISEIKLSEAYIKQGRVSAAKSVLERIIDKYGRTSDWGRQAVVILQQL